MSELKTKPTAADVDHFITSIENGQRRSDCQELLKLMTTVTGCEPTIWGDNIVGFGKYRYKYSTGREGDWFFAGFSPRKQNLTIYIISGFESFEEQMEKLGKYKTGSSCLYVNRLADIDLQVLEEMIKGSVEILSKRYPG